VIRSRAIGRCSSSLPHVTTWSGPRSGRAEALPGGEAGTGELDRAVRCGAQNVIPLVAAKAGTRFWMPACAGMSGGNGKFTPTPIPRTHSCGAPRSPPRSSKRRHV
jgi:hypothetical protein